jgi:hypothetical protein
MSDMEVYLTDTGNSVDTDEATVAYFKNYLKITQNYREIINKFNWEASYWLE